MAGRCLRGHRMEYDAPEFPGECILCRMEDGTAGPQRRDYDGTPLALNEHASSCPVKWWPFRECDCGAVSRGKDYRDDA